MDLERSIRYPLTLLEENNHLIEDGVKVHRASSCTCGSQSGPTATHEQTREVTGYMYRSGSGKESGKYEEHSAQSTPHAPQQAGSMVCFAFIMATPRAKECPMSPAKRHAKKQAKARKRRYLQAQERLARDRRQAQQAAQAPPLSISELLDEQPERRRITVMFAPDAFRQFVSPTA